MGGVPDLWILHKFGSNPIVFCRLFRFRFVLIVLRDVGVVYGVGLRFPFTLLLACLGGCEFWLIVDVGFALATLLICRVVDFLFPIRWFLCCLICRFAGSVWFTFVLVCFVL